MDHRARRWDRAGVAVVIGLIVAGHLWWIARHRATLAIDRDEAELLTWSELVRTSAARGPGAMWQTWTDGSVHAPLLGVSTAATTTVLGRSPLAILLPQLMALVVLLLAVWWIARQLGAGRWALLAVIVVGVAPGTVAFSRVHHQIIPGAAALAVCVGVGLRTDELRDRRWSLLLGAAGGLALLTRAMLVASVPLTIAGWLVIALVGRRATRAQVVNAALALAVTAGIAMTWFAFSLGSTIDHLTGNASADVGGGGGGAWTRSLRLAGRMLAGLEDYSPAWVGVGLLCVAVAICLVRAVVVRSARLRPSDGYILVVLSGTALALVVSGDAFPGFWLLVVPVFIAWATALGARQDRILRVAVLAPLACIGLAGLGSFPLTGSGWYQSQLWLEQGSGPDATGDHWAERYREVVADVVLATPDGCRPTVMVVQDENMVMGAHLEWTAAVELPRGSIALMRPSDGEAPSAAIERADRAGASLVLVDPTQGPPLAPRSGADLAAAATDAGYEPTRQWDMPSGSTLSLWTARSPQVCS